VEPETEATPESPQGKIPETVVEAAAPTLWSGARLPEAHAPERISPASPRARRDRRCCRWRWPIRSTGRLTSSGPSTLIPGPAVHKILPDRLRVRTITVDLSTSRKRPRGHQPHGGGRHHPEGPGAVFTGDRGTAVAGMAQPSPLHGRPPRRGRHYLGGRQRWYAW